MEELLERRIIIAGRRYRLTIVGAEGQDVFAFLGGREYPEGIFSWGHFARGLYVLGMLRVPGTCR